MDIRRRRLAVRHERQRLAFPDREAGLAEQRLERPACLPGRKPQALAAVARPDREAGRDAGRVDSGALRRLEGELAVRQRYRRLAMPRAQIVAGRGSMRDDATAVPPGPVKPTPMKFPDVVKS